MPPDVHTTLNYVKALDFGLAVVHEKGAAGITLDFIQEIHRILMNGDSTYRDKPGRIRTRQNWIRGLNIYQAKFVPPPADRLQAPLADFVQAMQYAPSEEDRYSVSVVVRMAIAHAQFELIHPFLDGNGRVGRILLPLLLVAEGYPPTYLAGFMKSNQDEYYRCLGEAQMREEWPQWVRFMAQAVRVSSLDAVATAKDLVTIKTKWREQVAGLRSDASALAAIDFIVSNPVVTVNKLKDHLGVSFPAANTAIDTLIGKGVLTEHPKQRRNRVFVAQEVIDRLEWRTDQIPAPTIAR